MIGFLLRALIAAAGLWIASRIGIGIEISTWKSLLGAAVLLGVVNAVVRPILVFITFPVTIVTLGLFLLVINGLMLELVAFLFRLVHEYGFQVHGFGAAVLGAIIVGLTSWVASWFIGPSGRVQAYRR